MSQPSSPSSPRRPNPDSNPDSNLPLEDSAPEVIEPPRRLLAPRERFSVDDANAEDASEEDFSSENASTAQFSSPSAENFVSNYREEADAGFEPTYTSRLDEEMSRRHLPPRERKRHERARIQREKREQMRRVAHERAAHGHQLPQNSGRSRVEPPFSVGARESAPVAPRKKRRMPRFLKRILWLVTLLFLGQLGFAVFTAPQFEIAKVEIEGLSATPPNAVRPIARRLLGQNVLRANRASVENATRQVPTVADAQVVRKLDWPPKVALQITERKPLLQVGAGQNWWVVDGTGVVFRRPETQDAALYRVVAPQFAPQIRQKLSASTWARAAALNAALQSDNKLALINTDANTDGEAAKNAASTPFWSLRRIYFDKDGLASLRVTRAPHSEMLVRLGDESWPEKLARARVALAYFERTGRRAAELDLVSLQRPVWKPVVAQSAAKTAPGAG